MKKGSKHTEETKAKISEGVSKWDDKYKDMVFELCLLGLGNQEMANVLGINVDTFIEWAKDKQKLSDVVREGKQIADGKVAKSLYNRAIGYEYTETHKRRIILDDDEDSDPVEAELEKTIIKHIPGDTGAAMNWLANRHRTLWRKNDAANVTVNIDNKERTDDELNQDIEDYEKRHKK